MGWRRLLLRAEAEAREAGASGYELAQADKAQRIADAITANCEAMISGAISQARWDAEQRRLWKEAAIHRVSVRVIKLVAPSLAGGAKEGGDAV